MKLTKNVFHIINTDLIYSSPSKTQSTLGFSHVLHTITAYNVGSLYSKYYKEQPDDCSSII